MIQNAIMLLYLQEYYFLKMIVCFEQCTPTYKPKYNLYITLLIIYSSIAIISKLNIHYDLLYLGIYFCSYNQ